MKIGFCPISVRITKFWFQDREDSVRTMIILATAYLYLHLTILSCNITNYYLIIELLMIGCLSIHFLYLCIFKYAFCVRTASYTRIMLIFTLCNPVLNTSMPYYLSFGHCGILLSVFVLITGWEDCDYC